jgi:hypothetical protein
LHTFSGIYNPFTTIQPCFSFLTQASQCVLI